MTLIPKDYQSVLSVYRTQMAIGTLKKLVETMLGDKLNLKRVSAPLFVDAGSGLNDDLNGVERPVSFDTLHQGGSLQIVHSLAKWKRLALYRYNFSVGEGLYTDMNAIRRDEECDNLHSIYVDQWDWEKVISAHDRTEAFLRQTVQSIVDAIAEADHILLSLFPELTYRFPREITFVTAEELEATYPDLTPKERENAFCRLHPLVFLMHIGGKLPSGARHDGRAPDYDDWTLNGDILVYNPLLDMAFEISSMGIRVDKAALLRQLAEAGCEERAELYFHRLLLDGTLPLTVGGGIGQSRLCMLLLEKAHIGEVQVSYWDEATREECRRGNIFLL